MRFVLKGSVVAGAVFVADAFFADFVSFGAFFYAGPRMTPIVFTQLAGYPVHCLPTHASVNRRSLASTFDDDGLVGRVTDALAGQGWRFERVAILPLAERGAMGGRPRAMSDADIEAALADLEHMNPGQVARKYGVNRSTLANYAREYRRDNHA